MSTEMRKALKELDFKPVQHDLYDAWVKTYHGFRLWIAETPKGEYLASIVVGKVEISIPNKVDDYWLVNFESQNIELVDE